MGGGGIFNSSKIFDAAPNGTWVCCRFTAGGCVEVLAAEKILPKFSKNEGPAADGAAAVSETLPPPPSALIMIGSIDIMLDGAATFVFRAVPGPAILVRSIICK